MPLSYVTFSYSEVGMGGKQGEPWIAATCKENLRTDLWILWWLLSLRAFSPSWGLVIREAGQNEDHLKPGFLSHFQALLLIGT